MQQLEKIMLPLAEKIARNKYLLSIRDGFLVSTPLLIAGSLFLLIENFPIPMWLHFVENTVIGNNHGETLATLLSKPSEATFSLMAIFSIVGIGFSYAKKIGTSPMFAGIVALVSWFLLQPFQVTGKVNVEGMEDPMLATLKGLDLGWVGARGIFIGIICAFTSVALYAWVEKQGWTIKMPLGVPTMVGDSFAALIPTTVVISLFFVLNIIFAFFHTNAFDIVFQFLQIPLLHLGDTVGAMTIAYLFLHVFWFFGVNGSSVVGAVFNPILQTLSLDNIEYFKSGVGQGHIINQQFQDLFATFGGAGSTLSLVIAILFFCKSKRVKELGKLSLIPGIFGINEPIIFGLPVVLNPTILLPFMLVPTLNIIISYFVMKVGMVPITNGVNIPWTTPIIISGFLATNWAGALLQLFLLVLGVFVYMPFIKIMDKQYLLEEKEIKINTLFADITEEMLNFDDL